MYLNVYACVWMYMNVLTLGGGGPHAYWVVTWTGLGEAAGCRPVKTEHGGALANKPGTPLPPASTPRRGYVRCTLLISIHFSSPARTSSYLV